MLKPVHLIIGLSGILLLSGCSFLSKDKDAYKRGETSKALEAPPELVIPPADSSYKVPEAVRASEIGKTGVNSTANTASVIPEFESITLERNDQVRWLHARVSPEQLWQPLLNFWRDEDLKLEEVNRDLGFMLTAWNSRIIDEERGKVSKFFSNMLSTAGAGDIREQYRLRIERDGDGSNIYLSYEASERVFEELPSGEAGASRWQPRKNDPEAEALMLKRIQLYLVKQQS